MEKQYGLILPDKSGAKKPAPIFTAAKNVFGNDSDSDEEVGVPKAALRTGDKLKRQARLIQEKALEDDPTVYQYDELYDDIEDKKKSAKNVQKEVKKPRYIEKLLETATLRKKENERRVERQGVCGPEKKVYNAVIDLYAEVIPEECQQHNIGRCIEVILVKENKKAAFWPSLTKDKKKLHWLKVDFNKMQDENDSGDEMVGGGMGDGGRNVSSLEDMMRNMGGLEDLGGKPSFDDTEPDSDDEEIPDLE